MGYYKEDYVQFEFFDIQEEQIELIKEFCKATERKNQLHKRITKELPSWLWSIALFHQTQKKAGYHCSAVFTVKDEKLMYQSRDYRTEEEVKKGSILINDKDEEDIILFKDEKEVIENGYLPKEEN